MREGKLNLAVLISGSGSNLQAIIDACHNPDFPARIEIVVSNNPDAYGLIRAQKAGLETCVIDHKAYQGRADFERALHHALESREIDLICLAGFMRILTPEFIEKWPQKIINTHPSLLPKFGGKGMYGGHVHKAVLEAGENESGPTIHYVIPEVDAGEIILQRKVDVRQDDTPDTLAARVLEQEHIAYPQAIAQIARERLRKTT
ncbi:MAG: phosphoribosylglycinamide formyltransferase [Alphaproteobacteria bacterium]